MSISYVCAVLILETPHGNLKKHVNWRYFESKAELEISETSSEAFKKFINSIYRIISSSKLELRYLKEIYFYEAVRSNDLLLIDKACVTNKIRIKKNKNEVVGVEVMLK